MIDISKSIFRKLKSKFNRGYEYYLTVYLIINVIWVFLGMFLYCYTNRFLYLDLSISYILMLIINFFIIVGLLFKKIIKFDKIDVFLSLLVIFGLISTVFAHNFNIALYGFRDRYEGFFQLLYYYSLMFLSTNIFKQENKKNIIKFILAFGLFNTLACILQMFDVFNFIPMPNRGVSMGQGFITNPNFFGSYMVLCLSLSIGLFLYNNKSNWIYLIFCMFLYSALLMSSTLSGIVGLFFVGLCILIYFIYLSIKKDVTKLFVVKHIALIISLIFVSIILIYSGKTTINSDIKKLTYETNEIVNGNFDDSYGTSRMFVWKNTLRIVPNHLLHGIGVDNFFYAFGDKPLYRQNKDNITFFDKAHNEYLQKLVCEGIFSCITYISMLFVVFFSSVKKIFKEKNDVIIALFFSFVGYCIQAFFNISVIEVAPLFWIVFGLLYNRNFSKKL